MAETQGLVMDFLTEEGYLPKRGEDGEIRFKKEGLVYLTFVNGEDPLYFPVYCFVNFGDGTHTLDAGLAAANVVNRRLKAIKVTFPDPDAPGNVSFGVESLLPTPDGFREVFARSLSIITLGIQQFGQEMSGSKAAE